MFILLVCGLAGCQSAQKEVNPQFGLQTLTAIGALKFDHGTNSIITDVVMRFEQPGKFELIASKSPTVVFCHLLADKEHWKISFPSENRTRSGHGPPGDERLALWIETQRMFIMAVKKAPVTDEFTEVLRGEYENGRKFTVELSEFRKITSQVFATRMRLTCHKCDSSIEVAVRTVR